MNTFIANEVSSGREAEEWFVLPSAQLARGTQTRATGVTCLLVTPAIGTWQELCETNKRTNFTAP